MTSIHINFIYNDQLFDITLNNQNELDKINSSRHFEVGKKHYKILSESTLPEFVKDCISSLYFDSYVSETNLAERLSQVLQNSEKIELTGFQILNNQTQIDSKLKVKELIQYIKNIDNQLIKEKSFTENKNYLDFLKSAIENNKKEILDDHNLRSDLRNALIELSFKHAFLKETINFLDDLRPHYSDYFNEESIPFDVVSSLEAELESVKNLALKGDQQAVQFLFKMAKHQTTAN